MKRIFMMMTMVVSLAGAMALTPLPAHAGPECDTRFLTFPTWYRGLTNDACEIEKPGSGPNDLSNFIWKIALNILEIFLQVVAYASVFFIIWGGLRYIYGAGTPDTIAGARKMIINAVAGLVIAMLSVAVVSFIVGNL